MGEREERKERRNEGRGKGKENGKRIKGKEKKKEKKENMLEILNHCSNKGLDRKQMAYSNKVISDKSVKRTLQRCRQSLEISAMQSPGNSKAMRTEKGREWFRTQRLGLHQGLLERSRDTDNPGPSKEGAREIHLPSGLPIGQI